MASSLSSLPSMVTITLLLLYHQMGPFGVMSNEDLILPSFSWDPRNECFNSNQTAEGFAHIRVDQDSQMYFLCPSSVITLDVQTSRPLRKNMYENMFMTTKDEFDSCEIKNINDKTRLVMKCDEPLYKEKLKFKHFSFTSFRSSMKGYEFQAGTTYYFIATSDGSAKGLESRKAGRCNTDNMRLAITICEHGKNCHRSNRRCTKDGGVKSKDSVIRQAVRASSAPKPVNTLLKTTNPPTTPPHQPVVTSVSDPNALRSVKKADSSTENYAVYIALAAAGGLVIGIFLSFMFLKLQKKASHFTSRNANRDSGAPSTVTEHLSVSESDDEKKVEQEDTFKCSVVEVADNPDPSVINQKYFSTLDFRNSNEFRRLISTASTCSSNRYSDSERHCVSPVGGYK